MGAKHADKSRKSAKSHEIVIPDKLFFRIGEVAELCSLPPYVLRFWETEFPQFKPSKSSTGQRLYRRRDVENIVYLKKLLHEQGYTIQGARQHLKTELRQERRQSNLPFAAAKAQVDPGLREVQQGLREVLGILSNRR